MRVLRENLPGCGHPDRERLRGMEKNMALTLMKGSEAIAEAAIRAGARFFFGYPITPQTEIP